MVTLESLTKEIRDLVQCWPERWIGVKPVFEKCVATLGKPDPTDESAHRVLALLSGGNAIANFVEHSCQKMSRTNREPDYHSRLHTTIVITSLTALLLKQRELSNSSNANFSLQEAALLVAMVGHDAGHNGTRNGSPCELESRSYRLIEPLLKAAKCHSDDMYSIKRVIWGTDPALISSIHRASCITNFDLHKPVWQTVLCQESDILASVLPEFANQMTQFLLRSIPSPQLDYCPPEDGNTFLRTSQNFRVQPHTHSG
ncbi:MAG: hypothetical protein VW645_08545 [Betaproteobacteria bacterium]